MDITLLITLAVATLIAILLLLILKRKYSSDEKRPVPQPRSNILPGARRRQPAFTRNARQRATREDAEPDDDNEEAPLDINLPEGKVGAKKLAKLQAKAEKKAHREAEDRDRQERKKKQEIEDEERRKIEEREKAEEKRKEDEERKLREEKEKQEHEEYLKMKEAFSVESEGYEDGEVEGSNALQDFVNHIKNNKVVVIEDIAAQFKLKTQQAIDRIQSLQADGILTGVVDDRGKFIYISRDELESVAKFVKQRGRVSIAELVENSNMLIDLTPRVS